MRQYLLVVVLLILAAGCSRDVSAPSAPVVKPTVVKKIQVLARPADAKATDKSPEPQSAPSDATPTASKPDSKPAVDDKEAAPQKKEAAQAGSRERIAILTPGGPLLVDVRLTIDGRPHTEGFEKLLKQILAAGDVDKDGQPTWTELVDNKKFLASKLVGSPDMNNYQARMWIETYDVNRDNRIQPSEAKSWLGRGASAGANAFAVRSEKSFSPEPSAASSVWKFLDVDHDGRLSVAETRRAPASLLSLDADDDRVITPRELASLRDQLVAADQQAASRLRGARRYAAIHLDADEDAERVHYLLQDAYAPRQDFGPKSFPDFPELFAALDANDDRWLDRAEMAKIFDIDPHVELTVDFAKTTGKPAATVKVRRTSPEVTALPEAAASDAEAAEGATDRVALTGGGARLIFSAHDLSAAADGNYQEMGGYQVAGRRQIRLMVHDQSDALFDALDENGDARLGEREIAFCGERLADRDANRDGQIAEDELPYSIVVAFLRGEPAQQDSFYSPPSSPRGSAAAKAPTWFVRADLNGDGDVSRREFLGARDQFARLDGNGDGYLDRSEIAMLQSEDDGSSG